MRVKTRSSPARLTEQIKRARAFAKASDGVVAELYLLHANMCEERRKAMKQKRRAAPAHGHS